eukprot:gnl/TRDRNA2_/TRDRNA2_181023_c0_seq1.p1 gnl/TRDRNA2_/TRDRNA2_181023_c0~~gnl/TRDRNA2_/TRDRNA2_181023_c0_seq1.p1  ORF type:complete len:457 (-),score=150.51 gnl/TRDRNA2_/TRDRNA2_181023_c0_seq1:230-1600(-)
MPIIFITIKKPDGALVHVEVDDRMRIEELRGNIAPKVGVKPPRQRLVFSGRMLQDGRTLEAYGIERNSTIQLLVSQDDGSGPGGVDISTIPKQLGALQRHVLQNQDILQQMLESPAMQSLLNDHELLRSLLNVDPKLQPLLKSTPELGQMLTDIEFMKQATENFRNPVHVRDVMRSTDRSMASLEALNGSSFDVLRQMCSDIKRPLEDPEVQRQMATKKAEEERRRQRAAAKKAKELENLKAAKAAEGGEQEGEEAEEEAEDPTNVKIEAPAWIGTFDTNAMASMMQDQNMQQLISTLVQSIGGPLAKPHPDDPFLDPDFLGQLYHSQTIQSMCALQGAVEKLSMAEQVNDKKKESSKKGDKGKEKVQDGAVPQQDESPAVLSGLHQQSPAHNFTVSFQLFLQAEQQSPEVMYKGQLQAMANMGFTNKEECIQALHSCDGNMNKAVDLLFAKQREQ